MQDLGTKANRTKMARTHTHTHTHPNVSRILPSWGCVATKLVAQPPQDSHAKLMVSRTGQGSDERSG